MKHAKRNITPTFKRVGILSKNDTEKNFKNGLRQGFTYQMRTINLGVVFEGRETIKKYTKNLTQKKKLKSLNFAST